MTVRAIVAPAFTRHLLIKLTDWKGKGGTEGRRDGGRELGREEGRGGEPE